MHTCLKKNCSERAKFILYYLEYKTKKKRKENDAQAKTNEISFIFKTIGNSIYLINHFNWPLRNITKLLQCIQRENNIVWKFNTLTERKIQILLHQNQLDNEALDSWPTSLSISQLWQTKLPEVQAEITPISSWDNIGSKRWLLNQKQWLFFQTSVTSRVKSSVVKQQNHILDNSSIKIVSYGKIKASKRKPSLKFIRWLNI